MRVIDRKKHLNISIQGEGVEEILELIRSHLPEAKIREDEEDEAVEWNSTELAQEISAKKTPGKLLQAYRLREGLTLVQLAEELGTKYPNLSAMENDRRTIGINMAKKLGKVLHVDFTKFLE